MFFYYNRIIILFFLVFFYFLSHSLGLSKFIKQVCAKFMNLIDEMVRNSFTKQRSEWGGNGAKLLLFNTPAYKKILEEIPDFPEIVLDCHTVFNNRNIKYIINKNGKMKIMLLMAIYILSLLIL